MSTVGELMILIAGNSAPLSASLAKSEGELKAFSGTAATTGAAAGVGLGLAATALAAGVGVFGVLSTKAAADFQAAMTLIQTQAGGSADEVRMMSDAILTLSPAVGFGPEALATALYHVESAGLRGSQALSVLTLAAQGAKVGHADLEAVTNALIATVNSGVGGVHNMSESMGVLNAITGAGNMRMQDLTAAFTTGILSVASTFGVSIQSVGAALADMTSQGVPAEAAATRLRMTLSLLGAPSATAAEQLKGIGLSSSDLANDLRSGGIMGAVTDLKEHLEGAGLSATEQAQLISRAFGGGRSSSAIMILLNSLDQLGTAQDQINKGTGAFGDAWTKTQEEVTFAGAQISATWDAIVVAIGTGFLPMVSGFLGGVESILSPIATWTAHNQGLAATILGVVGAVSALVAGVIFLGPILGAIGGALGVIFNPILAIGAAILGLAAHFGLLGEGAKSMADGIGTAILNAIPQVLATLSDLGSQAIAWIQAQAPIWAEQALGLGRAFIGWIGPIASQALAALGVWAGQVGSWIIAQAPTWMAQIGTWASAFIDWVSPIVGQVVAQLGTWAGQIGTWIAAQAPAWAAQIGTWVGAFVDWIAPMIPPALAALGNVASQILSWIADQVPGWVDALSQWAGAFVEWAAPLVGTAIGALGDFAGQLIVWVGQQVPKVVAAALPIGAAIIGGIVDALVGLPGAIGDALGDATKNIDPANLAANIGSVLSSVAVIGAVVIAGQAVGMAYAAATSAAASVFHGIADLIGAGLKAEQTLIASGVAKVGSFVGAAFSLAMKAAAIVLTGIGDAMIAAWGLIQPTLVLAMGPIGGAIGAALDTAIGVGMAIGVPLLIGAAIGAIGLALAGLINQAFPGLAQSMSENFSKGVAAVQQFIGDTMAKALGFIQTVIDTIKTALGLAGQLGDAINKPHTAQDTVNYHNSGKLPGYATGGMVPGATGAPQLAIVHGGETITPAGQGGGTLGTIINHMHVHLDGREIAEIIDQRLFGSASVFGSGFVGNPSEP